MFISRHVPTVQKSEYRSYFGNCLRYEVLVGKAGSQQNMILDFTETVMPRSVRYPLSYDTLQKTMLDLMLYEKPAKETIDQTEQYRQLEKENLIRLSNIFVEEVLANGRFDLNLGVRRPQSRRRLVTPASHLDGYGLRSKLPPRPVLAPSIRFLSIDPHVCSMLPSDPTSR
jgi:hypothetical protein